MTTPLGYPLRGYREHAVTGDMIPLDVCEKCRCDIEWFNGTWWVEGTCGNLCGGTNEAHVPIGGRALASGPVKTKTKSAAARAVFGQEG